MRVLRINKKEVKPAEEKRVDLKLIEPIIKKYKNKKGNLIPLLQGTQNKFGYIPTEAMLLISKETGLKVSDMYGVVTFYAQFRLNPVGKNIVKMCHGTACHVQNVKAVTEDVQNFLSLKDGETSKDGMFTLETVACLGCCSLAPVMMIGDESYGKLNGKKAVEVIKEIKRKETLAAKAKDISNN
ncbi:MAG: NADH-quinone oxidoreductase subunit NuoE [Ignavibacteriota bacterium]|nr:NADH-quinone oxidoreductase subunit NuoE [Ignavibacteriota bacterium]